MREFLKSWNPEKSQMNPEKSEVLEVFQEIPTKVWISRNFLLKNLNQNENLKARPKKLKEEEKLKSKEIFPIFPAQPRECNFWQMFKKDFLIFFH